MREISNLDIIAEGFVVNVIGRHGIEPHPDVCKFFLTWLSMHDKEAYRQWFDPALAKNEWAMRALLADRPAEQYQAWVIEFILVAT